MFRKHKLIDHFGLKVEFVMIFPQFPQFEGDKTERVVDFCPPNDLKQQIFPTKKSQQMNWRRAETFAGWDEGGWREKVGC